MFENSTYKSRLIKGFPYGSHHEQSNFQTYGIRPPTGSIFPNNPAILTTSIVQINPNLVISLTLNAGA